MIYKMDLEGCLGDWDLRSSKEIPMYIGDFFGDKKVMEALIRLFFFCWIYPTRMAGSSIKNGDLT